MVLHVLVFDDCWEYTFYHGTMADSHELKIGRSQSGLKKMMELTNQEGVN